MKTLSKVSFLVLLCAFFSTHLYAQNLTVSSQNNNNCSSPNGIISASVDGQTNGYSFEWFVGSSHTGPHLSWNPTVTNMVGGAYTVKATNDISGTVIGPVSVTISNDDIVVPVIFVQVVANETCVSPGSLKAIVSGADSDYTYAWYRGTRVSGVAISTDQTLNQLSAGTYTVKVTHKIFGCQNFAWGTVLNQRPPAQNISVEILSNVTTCRTPYNGSLKAIVPEVASNYTYQWFQGTEASGLLLSTSQTISNRPAGVYTVAVTHKTSMCKTVLSTTIQDQTIKPVVTVQVLSHVTSCTSSNGSLKANVSGSLSGYIFNWFRGATTTGPLISINQTVKNLAAGEYTVSVINRNTQCKTIISTTVLDNSLILSVQAEPVTSCWQPGTASVTLAGAPENYDIVWFYGTDITGSVAGFGQNLDMVPSGEYTVLVMHNSLPCRSTASVTIRDESVPPEVSVQAVSNTSCTSPNGELTAIVEGQPSDYYFAWFAGTDNFSTPAISENQSVDQLAAGIYTLYIMSNITYCEAIISATVADETTISDVSVELLSNNISCGHPSGALRAVTSGPETDYTFAWYQGTDISGSSVLSQYSSIFNLSGGIYTVKVTDINSGCESIVSAVVLDEIIPLNVHIEIISEQTSCTHPNGSLAAVVESGIITEYTFEWFEGAIPLSGHLLSMSSTIDNLSAGFYTVLVTDNHTGCKAITGEVLFQSCESVTNSSIPAYGTSVTEHSTDGLKVSYYPNPASETLWIESQTTTGNIVLTNRYGKIVYRQSITAQGVPIAVDLADQPSGIYVLTITSGSHTSYHRIVKN